MNLENQWNVAVIGAGTMGISIAQHFASKKQNTFLYNRTPKKLEEAKKTIEMSLNTMGSLKALDKGMTQKKALSYLNYTDNISEAVINANIVFECVSEDPLIKREVFAHISKYAPEDAYLCSDTSALNIYEFIEISNPGRLLITHFFNPPNVMPLVEIVKGDTTRNEVVNSVRSFLENMGKKPIVLEKFIPGFIFNRLLTALEREALYIVETGTASYKDVDNVITTTFGPRFLFEGIFQLLDYVGLDTEALVVGDLLKDLCNNTETPPLLLKKVEHNEFGIKTKKGFMDYSNVDVDELMQIRTGNIIKTLRCSNTLKTK